MALDKPANDKLLNAALNADIDTLYASIGYFYSLKEQLGVAPPGGRLLCIERGKTWIHEKGNDLRNIICNDVNIRRYYLEGNTDKERRDAILLLSDLIISICGGVPAINVAALLLKIGLQEWCNAGDRS
jgi:hypothetical protein